MHETYKKFAEEFIKDAGEIIREGFYKNLEKVWKEDNTVVTEYDHRINNLLVERVQNNFPDHAIHGEESGFVGDKNAKYVWVCDPIDGTKAFSMSLPHVTCMLALLEDGEPIYSIISDPILNRYVEAEKGNGAIFDGKPCTPSQHTDIAKSYVIYSVSRKYTNNDMWAIGKAIQETKAEFSFVPVGMAALLLASGNADAIVLPFFSDYEFVTYKLIFAEAGIKITALNGSEIKDLSEKSQGFIAASEPLHGKFVELIKPYLK